jgi:chemotaxis protein CheX
MTATAAIDRDTVVDVMADVWTSFLADDSLTEAFEELTPEGVEDRVAASVHVDGPWTGVIVVSTTRRAGRHVAARLLAVEDAEVTDGDMNDAVGEVANVLGGNLKTLLPPPSSMSLPMVARGDSEVIPAGAVPILHVLLDWRGEPVEIGIWES